MYNVGVRLRILLTGRYVEAGVEKIVVYLPVFLGAFGLQSVNESDHIHYGPSGQGFWRALVVNNIFIISHIHRAYYY
jgi:hypothetical protein